MSGKHIGAKAIFLAVVLGLGLATVLSPDAGAQFPPPPPPPPHHPHFGPPPPPPPPPPPQPQPLVRYERYSYDEDWDFRYEYRPVYYYPSSPRYSYRIYPRSYYYEETYAYPRPCEPDLYVHPRPFPPHPYGPGFGIHFRW